MKSLLRLSTLAQINTIALSFTAQSSSTRGLATIGSRYYVAATAPSLTTRFMSSTPPDTSVVDTCTKKIMAALETDDVKVIGMSIQLSWIDAAVKISCSSISFFYYFPLPILFYIMMMCSMRSICTWNPGAYDDPNGSHISIEVKSALFEGKRPVQRQQLVYKALWEELQGPVHAVDSMICKTPDE